MCCGSILIHSRSLMESGKMKELVSLKAKLQAPIYNPKKYYNRNISVSINLRIKFLSSPSLAELQNKKEFI